MKDKLPDIAKQVDVFFMEQSPIHQAICGLVDALPGMNIPFAIAGTMAANAHRNKWTTADVVN